MKKLISAAMAVIMTASLAAPLISSAEGPESLFYFTPKESSDITIESDGTVVVTRDALKKNGGLTVSADVFFQDESLSCWFVNPRWKSNSDFITLANVANPIPTTNTTILPYAYAETDEEGNLVTAFKTKYGTMASISSKNVAIFTCSAQQMYEYLTLEPYGEKSDDYPLTSFDMEFDKNIPYGEYEISFVSEADAAEGEQTSVAGFRTDNGSVMNEPNMRNMKIRVTGYNLGDVDNDGSITPRDASLTLTAYARKSTGEEYGLTTEEFLAANVIDTDDVIMPDDASGILSYYSYLSTLTPGETAIDISDYIKK